MRPGVLRRRPLPAMERGASQAARVPQPGRKKRQVDIFRILRDVIDLRSFSNLWYWIALAAMWSALSHWVMGVPHHMLRQARREGGQTALDVEALVWIRARRSLRLARLLAVPMFFGGAFMLSLLAFLAFRYRIEFAQAVFFLVAPMAVVGWLVQRTARKVEGGENTGEALYRRLAIHRRQVQALGLSAITATSMFGMYQNFNASILH